MEADANADPGSPGMKAFLAQAVRELLTNAVKHADTDQAWVRLQQSGDWLQVDVEDRGKGCDVTHFEWASRNGIYHGTSTMKQRVELLGGRFDVSLERGCKITLTVPVLR